MMQRATHWLQFRAGFRRGIIVIWAAFSLVLVLVFLAFSADIGYTVVIESELQNAADAGAMAGARRIPLGRATVVAEACLWANKNLIASNRPPDTRPTDVELGIWDSANAQFSPLPATLDESANAVRVTCRRSAMSGNSLQLFFGPIIGVHSMELKATAVSSLESDKCGMIVGVDSVVVDNGDIDSFNSADGAYSSSNAHSQGNVCSDGPITIQNNGHVRGDALPGRGYTVNLPNQVTGSTRPRIGSIRWTAVDPTDASQLNDNHLIPAANWTGTALLASNNEDVVLPAGTYYLPGGFQVTGGAAVLVTGPTTFVVGGSSLVSGRGIVNTTTVPGNLRIEVYGESVSFGGSAEFHADIYAPLAAIQLNGTADFYGAVFAKTLQFNGNLTAIHADEALERDHASRRSRSVLKQ